MCISEILSRKRTFLAKLYVRFIYVYNLEHVCLSQVLLDSKRLLRSTRLGNQHSSIQFRNECNSFVDSGGISKARSEKEQ